MVIVLGIDLGNFEIKVSYGESVDDILTNDIFKIENVISFTEFKRLFGTQAKKNFYNEYASNTFSGLKWLIGKKSDNEQLEKFLQLNCFNTNSQLNLVSREYIRLKTSKTNYFQHSHLFYPEELYTMILQNVKNQLISLLNGDNNETVHCVISVPFWYTLIEREILIKCCKAAGLKCLNLCNDTTSTFVHYLFTKRNLLNNDQKIGIVIDMGELALQISYAQIWENGIKILYTFTVENFGGQNFTNKIFEKIRTLDSYQNAKKKYNDSQLKLLVYRECEKAKSFGFNSPFEMRMTIDFSYVITKDEFEYLCSDLFGQFNRHVRQSFEEYAKKYKLPTNNPSKFTPINLLLNGSTMRIPMLKEIVKNVFNYEPKIIGKETIAKGCMLMANLFASKKTNVQIFDYLSYDLFTIGDLSMSCLANRFTYIPTKLLIRNVDYSEKYAIMVNNQHKFGKFKVSLIDNKKNKPKTTCWKLVLKNNGLIDKLQPFIIKEENGNEQIEQDVINYEFQMLIHSINTTDIRKKMFTFDRLEQYFDEGDKERFALENFIYESILFMKSISKHLPEAKSTELICMLEDEEKWLAINRNKQECLSKLELLNKILNSIKKQKEMYDKCLEKLKDYEKIIEENEDFCSIEKAIDQFHQDIDDFHTKIFKKLLDDHKTFFQRFTQNIFHDNILELVAGPEIIDQKIQLFLKDKDDIFLKTKPKKQLAIQPKPSHNIDDEDYCVPQISHQRVLKSNSTHPKRVHFADEEDSDNYEELKFDNKPRKYDEISLKNDTVRYSDEDDVKNHKEENAISKPITVTGKNLNLKIKGTEISSKGSLFSLRLQNIKGINFPNEWQLDIRLDRKEFRVQLDSMTEEYDSVANLFKPMANSHNTLINIWRIQNENLWANFYTRKSRMKTPNELSLWYGCDGAYFKHVCENNCQFRRSTFKCPDYGLGVYFYRDCTDAHKNVKPFYNVYYMFLCKVLTGKSIAGSSSISKLPKGVHSARDKKSLNKSSIFVIPRDSTDQIYPTYLVAYHVKN